MILAYINKFGQRRFAKWITILSFLTGVLGFAIKDKMFYANPLVYLGVFLLTAPHWFLGLAANKTKELRVFSIVASLLIIFVNFSLFFIGSNGYLFFVTLVELLLSIVFYVVISIQKKNSSKTKGNSSAVEK